jgi:hypothetical protein
MSWKNVFSSSLSNKPLIDTKSPSLYLLMIVKILSEVVAFSNVHLMADSAASAGQSISVV